MPLLVQDIRRDLKATLQEATDYEIATRDLHSSGKNGSHNRVNYLKSRGAMWLFVTTLGVEPTNNDGTKERFALQ